MIGKKIRLYREYRGFNQIQLAELSGINVGTIRKYELGLRNPKPDQLKKIADALMLNVSVFLDIQIETIGDVLTLLYAIDDSVDLSLIDVSTETDSDNAIAFLFKNTTLQQSIRDWCKFKNVIENGIAESSSIENATIKEEIITDLQAKYEEYKLRTMATDRRADRCITKDTECMSVKIRQLDSDKFK